MSFEQEEHNALSFNQIFIELFIQVKDVAQNFILKEPSLSFYGAFTGQGISQLNSQSIRLFCERLWLVQPIPKQSYYIT